jgi:hypothetical protein
MVTLKPRTRIIAPGVTVVLTAAGAGFQTIAGTVSGTFSPDDISIEGNMVIDGNNVATTGLHLQVTSHAFIDVTIIRCIGDGLVLSGAQWTTGRVTLHLNGGYGLRLEPYQPTGGRLPTSNNNRLRVFSQRNTSGGVYDDAGGANELQLTSQFHAGNGVTLVNLCLGEQFLGGHFEANDTHFNIGSNCIGTKIVAPYFATSTAVRRFIVNQGQDTVVTSYSTNSATMAAGGAHIEQNSGAGDITAVVPHRVVGATLFVDETGAVIDPTLGRLAVPGRMKVFDADVRQTPTTIYQTMTHSGSATTAAADTVKVDTDTGYRSRRLADGSIEWGPGDGTTDAGIKRISAGALGVTGDLRPAGSTQTLGEAGAPWPTIYFGKPFPNQCTFTSGSGSPNGVVTANPGSIYTNNAGGAGTTLYVKESGTGNTGWIAK